MGSHRHGSRGTVITGSHRHSSGVTPSRQWGAFGFQTSSPQGGFPFERAERVRKRLDGVGVLWQCAGTLRWTVTGRGPWAVGAGPAVFPLPFFRKSVPVTVEGVRLEREAS